jgi:hypothetical protein
VRTGLSAAHAYGWDELLQSGANPAWVLAAYLPFGAFSALQEELKAERSGRRSAGFHD